ncbi:hypothetical protein BJY52DRAFT_1222846 [Lactarius psammicola]|nr:hypothetical protein BJY52DRAFT_1222846 [Lactarius psammicola]
MSSLAEVPWTAVAVGSGTMAVVRQWEDLQSANHPHACGLSNLHITGVHQHTTPATAEADKLRQVPSLVPSCLPSSHRRGACGDGRQPHCKDDDDDAAASSWASDPSSLWKKSPVAPPGQRSPILILVPTPRPSTNVCVFFQTLLNFTYKCEIYAVHNDEDHKCLSARIFPPAKPPPTTPLLHLRKMTYILQNLALPPRGGGAPHATPTTTPMTVPPPPQGHSANAGHVGKGNDGVGDSDGHAMTTMAAATATATVTDTTGDNNDTRCATAAAMAATTMTASGGGGDGGDNDDSDATTVGRAHLDSTVILYIAFCLIHVSATVVL